MTTYERFMNIGVPCAAAYYEEPERSRLYRKSLALRVYFETLPLAEYKGTLLYPSGSRT